MPPALNILSKRISHSLFICTATALNEAGVPITDKHNQLFCPQVHLTTQMLDRTLEMVQVGNVTDCVAKETAAVFLGFQRFEIQVGENHSQLSMRLSFRTSADNEECPSV